MGICREGQDNFLQLGTEEQETLERITLPNTLCLSHANTLCLYHTHNVVCFLRETKCLLYSSTSTLACCLCLYKDEASVLCSWRT